jgi:hypothetical protein
VHTLLTKEDEKQIISRFTGIPLEKRELLVRIVMSRLQSAEQQRKVYRYIYILFLKADMLKGLSWQ